MTVANGIARIGAFVKQHEPEILTFGGLAAMTAGAVLACRATLKTVKIHDEHEPDVQEAQYELEKMTLEMSNDPSSVDSEEFVAAMQAAGQARIDFYSDVAKQWALPFLLYVIGMMCVVKGHMELKDRLTQVLAAYSAIVTAYAAYRERVVDEFGQPMDEHLMYGTPLPEDYDVKAHSDVIKKLKNSEGAIKPIDESFDPTKVSMYARFFDEASGKWDPSFAQTGSNYDYVRGVQDKFNLILKTRKYVFLDEVYNALGIPYFEAAHVVGWLADGEGDGYIDLGLIDPYNKQKRMFVNGYEPSILIDPNVDGVIIDKIADQFRPSNA